MTQPSRYRVEDGRACIDIEVKTAQQLFDGRDPAPFRERDLDEDAVDYVLGSVAEIPKDQPLRIVVVIAQEPEPTLSDDVLVSAIRSHFEHERKQIERRLREHVRTTQFVLVVGLTALAAFLTLSTLTTALPRGNLREILREGLLICGWVAVWRPLEALLYDWWPIVASRRRVDRVVAADVSIRRRNR